ncbi:MurR/RpiR family transcriptional regulator [Enterococcus sp. LJL120]
MSYFENLDISDLSNVEQEIYRYIVNNPEKILYMRVRDIAENSHTSATSVFRFINKIGYESFTEFRLSYKQKLKFAEEQEGINDNIDHHFQILKRDNFNQDLAYQIEKVTNILRQADITLCFGIGQSGSIAEYTARKMLNQGFNAIGIKDFIYPINSHFHRNQKNVLLVFTSSGETQEILERIASIELRQEVFICCITKNRNSPVAKLCDYVIDYTIQNAQRNVLHIDFSTQLPAMFIAELLTDHL